MPKIVLAMIAYRERYLAESIRDCLDKAANPEDLIFSVVSEQATEDLHPDLSFVPANQLVYRKYDLSEFRGITWSRKTAAEDLDIDYDYMLWTCGHNIYAPRWDEIVVTEHTKATSKFPKAIITSSGPEFEYEADGSITYVPRSGRTMNKYRPAISPDYVPGYGFPNSLQAEIPETDDVIQDAYMQWSWVFAPKEYVKDVPIEAEVGYHGEELYSTVIAWARGWRFFATPEVLYYHDTYKEYPGESGSRMDTKRPWIDLNQKAFWDHSDVALDRLNQLLSGELYKDVSKEAVLAFCSETGMNPEICKRRHDYHKLGLEKHAEGFRNVSPIL
jgi:hypothetical protein